MLSIITSNTEGSLIYLALKVYQYINWISIWMRGTWVCMYRCSILSQMVFLLLLHKKAYFINQKRKSSFTLPINSMHLLWCLFYIINSVDIKVFKRFSKCIQIRAKKSFSNFTNYPLKIIDFFFFAKKVYNLCSYLAPPKSLKGKI